MGNIIYPVVGILAGVGGFFWGFGRFKLKRIIENIPTAKVRSMPMGKVEISGKAIVEKTVESPFTKRSVVYYRCKIEQWVEDNEGKGSWKTVHKHDSGLHPFYIQDETGKALIRPYDAELHLPKSFRMDSLHKGGIPSKMQDFMDKWNIKYHSMLGSRYRMRFTEQCILPNETVYILGSCQDNRSQHVQAQENRVGEVVSKLKENPELMKQYDTNSDGEISAQEWSTAMLMIEAKVKKEMSQTPLDKIFIGKAPQKNSIFILSNKSEKTLVREMGLYASAGVFGGATIATASVWFLMRAL